MQDLFIEFLPPWVETGLQPAFYDRESGTVLQQTARMYAKVNELVKAVNGMDKVIKEYVDYIDNYFKNLDVQEEINNKLDDMAEGGELAEFIALYADLPCVHAYATIPDMASSENLEDGSYARAMSQTVAGTGDGAYYKVRETVEGDTPDGVNLVAITDTNLVAEIIPEYPGIVKSYDTVSDMVADIMLVAGNIAKTAGFHSANDGGGVEYIIRNAGVDEEADDAFTFELDNGLIAEIIKPNQLFIDQLGAYGDGIHDDATLVQLAIEKLPMGTLYFGDKTYAFGSVVKTYIDKSKITNLILSNNTIIKALSSIDALFELGGLGGSNAGVDKRDYWFKGGKLDGTNCQSAIKINPGLMGQNLEGVEINYATIGLYMPKDENNYPGDLKMDGCVINGRGSQNSTVGVYCERTDNKFVNSRINACTKAFYFVGGGQTIINVHGMGVGAGSWWDNSIFAHFHSGGGNLIQSSYCDTFKTIVKNDTDGDFTLSGCWYYSYLSNVDCELFKIDGNQFSRFTITDNSFDVPVASTQHKGITFSNYGDGSSANPQTTHIANNLVLRSGSFVKGDFLLKVNNYSPYWFNAGNDLSTSQWLKVGYVPASVIYNRLAINIGGWLYRVNFKIEKYGSTVYLTQRTSSTEATGTPVKIGFKYENNTNGPQIFGVYVQQISGSTLPSEITVIPEIANIPFMPLDFGIKSPTLETLTMDATMDIVS